MRARRGGWAAVLLAGAAGVGPLLWATAGPAWAFVAPVMIVDRPGGAAFSPDVVTIEVDDKVLWKNESDSKDRHTVVSDPGSFRFGCSEMAKGGQCEKRFTVAGTFTYHCDIHPNMVGRIEVVDPSAPTTTAPPTTTTTAPPTTTTTAPTPTTTEPPTTTTTAQRPAAGPPAQPLPPVPSSAAAPPPTLATSSTTTVPPSSSSTTTTSAPPTTVTTAPPTLPGEGVAGPPTPESPPSTAAPDSGDELPTAAGPIRSNGGELDAGAVAMVSALVAVGAFAAWTLIRVRPGRV